TTTGLPADHGEPQLPTPLDTTMPVVDGSTFSVDDSCANLQTQLNACAAADRSLVHQVMIPPTAVCRGTYTLPVKTGIGSNTVVCIVRSAAPDAVLPPEGVRITPEYE